MAATLRLDPVRATLLALALALAGACASTIVQPEDMSVEAHRKEAAKDREIAAEHRRQYDPSAERLDRSIDTAQPRPDLSPPYNGVAHIDR